jgi:molybdopterin-guanine dinucleotide biosynthesis protein A
LRLGRIKALERINKQRLIERTIERISPPVQTIFVITSREQFDIISASLLNVQVVVDFYPGKGALGGIYTGLSCADSLYSLVVGCDMPFLNRHLLSYIVERVASFDAVVPRLHGMMEPLHSVYSKNCLVPMEKMMQEDRLEISYLFNLVKTRYVDEGELAKFDSPHLSFFNINTVADLREARRLVKLESQGLYNVNGGTSCD